MRANERGLGGARRKLADMRLRGAAEMVSRALKANFNSNEPRVPAGRHEGGQWRRLGGTELAGSVVEDRGGGESWSKVTRLRRRDGSVAGQAIVNRDGSTIEADYPPANKRTGWTSRYTVTGADGTTLIFENAADSQSIFDTKRRLLKRTRWTPEGPVSDHRITAFAGGGLSVRLASEAAVRIGVSLFNWLSGNAGPAQAGVLAFVGKNGDLSAPELGYVAPISVEQARLACPRLQEVQERTDEAVRAVRETGRVLSPSQFGTAVHLNLKQQIDDLNDPRLLAEVSILKSADDSYDTPGSVRIDVVENIDDQTICVYDIKAGNKGLSPARLMEITSRVKIVFSRSKIILIMEVRPTR